jgi:hypothetical protein
MAMTIIGVAVAGLMLMAVQEEIVIRTGNYVSPKYHWTDYQSACGENVFRVRFRNGPEEGGRVDHFLIDGRPVPGAAETLQVRAARRFIDSIGIMHCGMDEANPTFLGSIHMDPALSRVFSLRDTLFFRLTKDARGDWRFTFVD